MQLMFSLSEKHKWVAISVIQTLVVLATGLWPVFFKETHLPLTVRYTHVSEEFIVVPPSTKTVDVLVRGLKFRINEAKKRELGYILDLSSSRIGVNTFLFNFEDIPLPKGLSVVRSNLSTLVVKLDHKIRKKLPVQVVVSGKPETGYDLVGTGTEPRWVWVEGSKTLLEPLTLLKTKPLDIGNADETIRKEAVLDLPEGLLPLPSGVRISAKVLIEEKIITKAFKSVPVQGKNSAYDFSIAPSGAELIIKGPFKVLDTLTPETDFEVLIDLSGSSPGEYKRYATIRLPVEMVLVSAKPEWFTVKIHQPSKKAK